MAFRHSRAAIPGCPRHKRAGTRKGLPPRADDNVTRGRIGGTPTGAGRSVRELLLQLVDLVLEPGVARELTLDLANGVQDRGVIAVAETTSDLGQGA